MASRYYGLKNLSLPTRSNNILILRWPLDRKHRLLVAWEDSKRMQIQQHEQTLESTCTYASISICNARWFYFTKKLHPQDRKAQEQQENQQTSKRMWFRARFQIAQVNEAITSSNYEVAWIFETKNVMRTQGKNQENKFAKPTSNK